MRIGYISYHRPRLGCPITTFLGEKMAVPTNLQVTENEITVAFQRAKRDRPRRCFIDYPLLLKWAEFDKKNWLECLRKKIQEGYQPHTSKMCFVPKPKHLVRPANIIHLKDEVVYNIIVGRLYDYIYRHLMENNIHVDCSYPLSEPPKTEWINPSFNGWKKFGDKSISYIEDGYRYVVFSDITGF